MPATTSPFFGINYGWTTGENSWGDPVNANFKALSFLGKGAVDEFVATLPASPSEGDSVVLTTDNQFYVRLEGAWLFIQPQDGQEVNEIATGKRWQFGGSWVDVTPVKSSDMATLVESKRFEGTATDDQGTPDAIFRVNRTHAIGSSAHSFRDQTTFSSNTANRAIASYDAAMSVVSPLPVDHTIGFQSRSTHIGPGLLSIQYGSGSFNNNTGNISTDYAFYNGNSYNGLVGECFGFYNRPLHFTNTVTSYGYVHKPAIGAGATVTNSIGVRIETADGSGSVTNEFGIYVKNLTKGTNRWPLYIEAQAGLAYIAAKTQIDALFQTGGSERLSIGGTNPSSKPWIAYNYDPVLDQYIGNNDASGFLWTSSNFQFRHALTGLAGATPTFTALLNVHTANDADYGAVFPGTTNVRTLGLSTARWAKTYSTEIRPGVGATIWTSGAGTPEGVVTAPVGSMFTRTDGGAITTLYIKESGAGNTGWVVK